MTMIDLTSFGYTPTESLLYGVLLSGGPGTGYAIARTANLARANAYAALEGLVAKGAARSEDGRPKRYRPEPPDVLLGRIMDQQGRALEDLSRALEAASAPQSETLVELTSARGTLQLLSHESARAGQSILMHLPSDAWGPLTPALRRAAGVGVSLILSGDQAVDLGFASITAVSGVAVWPGDAVLAVIDGRCAVVATRHEDTVTGYWGTNPAFVASATLALEQMRSAS